MVTGLVLAMVLQAQAPLEPAPGTDYDPAVPTLEQVVGHDFGEEVTPPEDITRYLQALAEAAPDRTHLIHYADTWEGRPLHMLAISSAANIARRDRIQAGLGQLADPRGLSDADAEALISDLPTVVVLMHGVHGDEISSSGAAMTEAYHLLAARNDGRVDQILDNVIVLIDPAENPDGRARSVMHTRAARGAVPDSDPLSAEHDEPWPGGRTNHYLFDMNRDWFIQSQPETRGRTRTMLQWPPQVVVDLHEMGGNNTYFFPPPAPPVSPWVTESQKAGWDLMGESIADEFDGRGFAYFNNENFDAFYPGYGDSWPGMHGAISMTFEQAGAGGLVYDREDGTQLTYNDGVVHHFTAALITAYTAATNRERLLRDYLEFRRTAVELGADGVRTYVLHSQHDPAMAARLAGTLAISGVEVYRADEPVSAGGRTLPAGTTYLVPVSQPSARLIRSLLDPDIEMDAEFLERQRQRMARRLDHEMYDVTAWSLPLLWDVEAIGVSSTVDVATTPVDGSAVDFLGSTTAATAAATTLPDARVGYLLPWGTATAAAVAEALGKGIRVRALGDVFTLDGREYPIGTALIRTAELGDGDRGTLAAIVARHGAEAVPANSGYVEDGISLGSNRVEALKAPKVALVWDEPARAYSAGWARYVLEQRHGQRVSAIRAGTLGRAQLPDYNVIVLPSGDYSDEFSDGFLDRLRGWMRDGGTLVTMAGSSAWAAEAGLLETGPELRGGKGAGDSDDNADDDSESAEAPEQPIDYLEAIRPESEDPIVTPGSILNGVLDTTHWLSSGTDGRVGVLVEGDRIFSPVTLEHGTNVGRYAEGDDLVASGIVWDESRDQLMNKAFLVHQPMGDGHLIAFAEDPNYRGYTAATSLLFMNAILMGPAF